MRIRWQNYRGYNDTGWVTMSPLTLLIGANNAGKTSLYSPLLLLKQTRELAHDTTPLLTQGPLYDAGRFRDYARNHDRDAVVTFSLDLTSFSVPLNVEARYESSLLPALVEISFTSADADGRGTQLERYRLLGRSGKVLLRRQRRPDGSFGLDGPLLPSEKTAGRPPGPVSNMRASLRAEEPTHFTFSGIAGIRRVGNLRATKREHQDRVNRWLNAGLQLFQLQQAVNLAVDEMLESLSYVGPLRALPQRTYRVSAEPPKSVGISGEYAPEMLFRDFIEGDGELLDGVNEFLRGCGYGGISFKPGPDNDSFELLLTSTQGTAANIVDSGMGISQLLPLVTQSLASSPGSQALVQQPEIHLNPALQVKLMDHFVHRVREGNHILIETHSEHMLLRLRRLVAQGELDSDLVNLLYSDNSELGSEARSVELAKNGNIARDEWPFGFFEEQLQDSLLLAREQSRRARAR